VAALVIAAAATTGTVYIVHGTALAMTEWFGGQASLGYLMAGLTCLALVMSVLSFGSRLIKTRRRDELVDKYDQRKSIERAEHGRDVDQASREAA
jgi:hypothetical protein